MLQPRITPCLLVQNGGLVKTTKFKNPKYVGDPLNAVRIFNEKKVDEIIVLDIDVSKNNEKPKLKLIENLAEECQMPLCYGGGIKSLYDAQKIFSLGVEKYFAQKLTDYDPSVNNGNWQWTSGSGADSQPYFRIMNPWSQSEKFDKNAEYIKKWVPELKDVEPKHLHNWEKFHINYDINYPSPIIDYKSSRKKTLDTYKKYLN